MNNKEALEILDHHNRWRRNRNTPNSLTMVNPEKLGKAIEVAMEKLKEDYDRY